MWYCSNCYVFHDGDCPRKARNDYSYLSSILTPKFEPLEPIRPTFEPPIIPRYEPIRPAYEPIIPRYDPLPPPFDPYRFPLPPPPLPEPPPIIMPPMPDYGPPQSTPEVWQPGYTPYTPNFG